MKVLFFYTYNKSFLSRFFHELSIKLLEDGHEVKNFSFKKETQILDINDIEIVTFKKGSYLSYYYRVFSFVKRYKPDIIISNFSYVNPALLSGKLLGVKKNIVWFHSLKSQINPSSLRIFLKSKFLKLSDKVIANSNELKHELESIYKVPIHKLRAIPFWSTIDRKFDYSNDKTKSQEKSLLKIGCPGRLVSHKNQEVVIRALFELKSKSITDIKLFISGKGEEENNLRNLVSELGLCDQVDFLGHLSESEMVVFYNNMNIIVLPSLHEAFGLVFIEAISLGVPVIVSNKFGALSFIEKQGNSINDNYLFEPTNVNELADKIIDYYRGKGIKESFFKTLYIDNFDKEVIYSRFLNALDIVT